MVCWRSEACNLTCAPPFIGEGTLAECPHEPWPAIGLGITATESALSLKFFRLSHHPGVAHVVTCRLGPFSHPKLVRNNGWRLFQERVETAPMTCDPCVHPDFCDYQAGSDLILPTILTSEFSELIPLEWFNFQWFWDPNTGWISENTSLICRAYAHKTAFWYIDWRWHLDVMNYADQVWGVRYDASEGHDGCFLPAKTRLITFVHVPVATEGTLDLLTNPDECCIFDISFHHLGCGWSSVPYQGFEQHTHTPYLRIPFGW